MSFPVMTPREAYERMQTGARYLDVRTPEEFAEGHPQGAVNVPVFLDSPSGRVLNPDFVEDVREQFPQATALVIGCRSGGRSAKACQLLLAVGYTNVANIDGGFAGRFDPIDGTCLCPGWEECGLPVDG